MSDSQVMPRQRPKVLVTDKMDLEALFELEKIAEVARSPHPHLKGFDVAPYEILVIRSKTEIYKNLLDRAPNLKFIVTATSGFDHIDLEETKARSIRVAHTPNANAQSAAELTWALVLACARRLVPHHNSAQQGTWNSAMDFGAELSEKTYGVVGLGRIGSRVAKIAKAFGMKVVVSDPYVEDSVLKDLQVERFSLDEVVRLSDVVSVHVPFSKRTRKFINAGVFEGFSDHAIFVNTSRGDVIDERALVEALRAGDIAAAGLDVFEREPLDKDHPLCLLSNVVLSPHVGARTHEAIRRASLEAVTEVAKYLAGEASLAPLPPPATWFFEKY